MANRAFPSTPKRIVNNALLITDAIGSHFPFRLDKISAARLAIDYLLTDSPEKTDEFCESATSLTFRAAAIPDQR